MNTINKIPEEVATSSIITVAFGLLSIIVVTALLFTFSFSRDEQLSEVSDCVVETAQAQGYAGNPYSQESWKLFENNCR